MEGQCFISMSSHDSLLLLITQGWLIERNHKNSDLCSYKVILNINNKAQEEKVGANCHGDGLVSVGTEASVLFQSRLLSSSLNYQASRYLQHICFRDLRHEFTEAYFLAQWSASYKAQFCKWLNQGQNIHLNSRAGSAVLKLLTVHYKSLISKSHLYLSQVSTPALQ